MARVGVGFNFPCGGQGMDQWDDIWGRKLKEVIDTDGYLGGIGKDDPDKVTAGTDSQK